MRKALVGEIPNDPPLYRIDVIFWKDETSINELVKMMKALQPNFIALKEGFLKEEVEAIEKIVETSKKHCLKRQGQLRMFKVAKGATINTPGIKTLSQLTDITQESIA